MTSAIGPSPSDRWSWHCPRCWSPLAEREDELICGGCVTAYAKVAGVPDLRLEGPAWIDFAEDRERARELVAAIAPDDVEGAIEFVFRRREGWSDAMVERRVQQVLQLTNRMQGDLDDWLAPIRTTDGPVLDIGCGPGTFLAATSSIQRTSIGVDVSLEWLVVAQRLIRASGGTPLLACALAEALPLGSETVGCVTLLDVIEHVSDPAAVVREVNRVLVRDGIVALATPNRFSLASEPHVDVWGVGWLPSRLQERYVRLRSGKQYGFVRLLSRRGLVRLFHRHTDITVRVSPARVPAREIGAFSRRRAFLAKLYNQLVSRRGPARLLAPISPFFHLIGSRR